MRDRRGMCGSEMVTASSAPSLLSEVGLARARPPCARAGPVCVARDHTNKLPIRVPPACRSTVRSTINRSSTARLTPGNVAVAAFS